MQKKGAKYTVVTKLLYGFQNCKLPRLSLVCAAAFGCHFSEAVSPYMRAGAIGITQAYCLRENEVPETAYKKTETKQISLRNSIIPQLLL